MRHLLIALAAALTLSACATVQKLDAANDVHALLISIRDNDQQTFDSLVDRKALKREIADRLATEGAKDKRIPTGLAAILAPSLAELAGDTLIQPQVFRSVAEYYGYTPQTKIPNTLELSTVLRQIDDLHVCATKKKDGPCLLVFTKATDGRWKLTSFDGELSMLRIKI